MESNAALLNPAVYPSYATWDTLLEEALDSRPGKFIVFEGLDGAGKTTLIDALRKQWYPDAVYVREPGGTALAEQIRNVLLSYAQTDMNPLAQQLLFNASRASVVDEIIVPALNAGRTIFADRFWWSSFAYGAEYLDTSIIQNLSELSAGMAFPHLTILLDGDPRVFRSRSVAKNPRDAEDIDMMDRIRRRYLELWEDCAYTTSAYIVDATRPLETVLAEVRDELFDLLGV